MYTKLLISDGAHTYNGDGNSTYMRCLGTSSYSGTAEKEILNVNAVEKQHFETEYKNTTYRCLYRDTINTQTHGLIIRTSAPAQNYCSHRSDLSLGVHFDFSWPYS